VNLETHIQDVGNLIKMGGPHGHRTVWSLVWRLRH
jgi:hypothetical protein